jgi:hypothetical protein
MRDVEQERAAPEPLADVPKPPEAEPTVRPERTARPSPVRRGRCETHPSEPQVASCELCGRALCLSCAIPVRGSVVGHECLSKVVEDAPRADPPAVPHPHGDLVAMVGFAVVVVSSIEPWARFGDASGMLGGWRLHWSLLALCAAALGLVAAAAFRSRPRDPRGQTSILLACAAIALLGTVLHGIHPPALSQVAPLGWGLGLAGSLLALLGALWNSLSVFRPPA